MNRCYICNKKIYGQWSSNDLGLFHLNCYEDNKI